MRNQNRNPERLTVKKIIRAVHGNVMFKGGIEIISCSGKIVKRIWSEPHYNKQVADRDANALKGGYINDMLTIAGVN